MRTYEFSESTMSQSAPQPETPPATPTFSQDLSVLLKVRLNVFVLITTFFGFLLASRGQSFDFWRLFHTLLGTAAAAFGSAAFNQLMEIDLDARMRRTADRPLPSRRMEPGVAFGIGWVLAALGVIHLGVHAGWMAAYLAAATVGIYVFVYTPLKRKSTVNTLVGAIPGAIPPVIGWCGAGGTLGWQAVFLFALLFFWQLPHFIAINWLCREEYETAGYKMWSNGDVSGRKSSMLSILFSLVLAAVSLMPWLQGFAGLAWGIGGPLLGVVMAALAWKFRVQPERATARKLFFFTLLYLPLALGLLTIAWR